MDKPVVLITGALTGIGRATAIAFARDGARLVVIVRLRPGLGDFFVEGFDADFEPFGLGFAHAVVLGGGKPGEGFKSC